MSRLRLRPVWALAVVVVVLSVVLPEISAGAATTAERLAALKSQIRATQKEADGDTARYEAALARSATLQDEISAATQSLRKLEVRVRAMRDVVRERAVTAYMAAGTGQLSALLGTGDVLQAARTTTLMSFANQKSNDVINTFRVTNEKLNRRIAQLRRAQRDERTILVQSEATARRINERLITLQQLDQQLQRRQVAEAAAQRAAAARAATTTAAPSTTRTTTTIPPVPPSPDGPTGPPPTGGSQGVAVCPIRGPVSFTDTWGDPRGGGRTHQGVDMLSPFGTPNVAVTSGRIVHNSGPNEGNGLFLYGDNGDSYWYFHLSSYEGGPRHVQTGEVIGYVGATGDTTANHTHFEIHPGGGGPIDPYSAVRAVC